MKTIQQSAAALLVAAVAAAAAAQDVPDRIKKAGKIVAATQPNYAPISYKDPATNQLMGFDIELGEAIAKELGVKIEWQETAFAQMISSLVTGRVDIVMAGMSDLPGRREQVDFVDYLKTGAQFYTSQANAATIKTPADLCGKKVGASRSTNWPGQIEEWSKQNCVAKGKPAITVVGTEGSIDARTQLKSGRLDGGVQGSETLSYFQKLEPNTYVVLGTRVHRIADGDSDAQDRAAAARRGQGRARAAAEERHVRPDRGEVRARRQQAFADRRSTRARSSGAFQRCAVRPARQGRRRDRGQRRDRLGHGPWSRQGRRTRRRRRAQRGEVRAAVRELQALGTEAIAIGVDVTDEASVDAMVGEDDRAMRPARHPGEQRRDQHPQAGARALARRVAARCSTPT